MKLELINCDQVMIEEIADPKIYRNDIAKTYALALKSSFQTDWSKVNEAIIKRWSIYALNWIKNRAWSGKCFEEGGKD